jgi:hypothetical protein
MKPWFKYPIYKPLENKRLFNDVKADGMTISWNDDIDMCPDELYINGKNE